MPGLSEYDGPGQWRPHISLAYGDLTTGRVPEARARLAAQGACEWAFEADNIRFITEPDGQASLLLPDLHF